MFERYTERARRAVFFARYEASQFGSTSIESEHLLLGLIRENKNLTNRFNRNSSSIDSIRREIKERTTIRNKISTSIDLPLSDECKRILAYAAEEAELLEHRHIGTEHLLLGVLREEKCVAAELLNERGLKLESIREELARSEVDVRDTADKPFPPTTLMPGRHVSEKELMVPDEGTARRIANAIWTPAFGPLIVANQQPPNVELKMNIWIITGSEDSQRSEGQLYAFIHRTDGKVISMGQKSKESNV